MEDFGDIGEFSEAAHGKAIKAYQNGIFENPKVLFVQHHWSWDEFLCAASMRLEMVPSASRAFNADGAEIDDIMCIEENDMVFFSTGQSFIVPSSGSDTANTDDDKYATIVGGYKVAKLLGRGGFGEVRLGIHQLTNEKVALKFILKSEMGSLGDVERTTTEIQCLTALNHPSITQLRRVVNEPDHVVLVFELLEGGDLFHYLKVLPKPLPEEEGAALFAQILAGVGYAHNQHICHRDLKLENILLSNKNDLSSVKLTDFGLSDFYKPGAMVKTSCGSLSYLAPEVFRGTSNAGPPLDVWSMGVILFAIACGRLPFEGSDLQGTNRPRENVIRNRILRGQFTLDEHLSPECCDLITHMLKPDPNERATIPEIFSHPWVRGIASGGYVLDMQRIPSREGPEPFVDNEDEDIVPPSSEYSSPTASMNTKDVSPRSQPSNTGSIDVHDEKTERLPSIVSRSPTRTQEPQGFISSSNSGLGIPLVNGVSSVPSNSMNNGPSPTKDSYESNKATPATNVRARLGRVMDPPLKQSVRGMRTSEKSASPRLGSTQAQSFKSNGSGSMSSTKRSTTTIPGIPRIRLRPTLIPYSGISATLNSHSTSPLVRGNGDGRNIQSSERDKIYTEHRTPTLPVSPDRIQSPITTSATDTNGIGDRKARTSSHSSLHGSEEEPKDIERASQNSINRTQNHRAKTSHGNSEYLARKVVADRSATTGSKSVKKHM